MSIWAMAYKHTGTINWKKIYIIHTINDIKVGVGIPFIYHELATDIIHCSSLL